MEPLRFNEFDAIITLHNSKVKWVNLAIMEKINDSYEYNNFYLKEGYSSEEYDKFINLLKDNKNIPGIYGFVMLNNNDWIEFYINDEIKYRKLPSYNDFDPLENYDDKFYKHIFDNFTECYGHTYTKIK